MIDVLWVNEGTSDGAKKGWDKRGRGRKQEPSVAKRFAAKADTSELPKLKAPASDADGKAGKKAIDRAFYKGAVPTEEELDSAVAEWETAKAEQIATQAAWIAKGSPASGAEHDAGNVARDALTVAEKKLREIRKAMASDGELTGSSAKDLSVQGVFSHLPKDADLSALNDYNKSSRYNEGATSPLGGQSTADHYHNIVDTVIDQWSQSSADTSVRSLEMQMAVAREFKLGNEERVAVRLNALFAEGRDITLPSKESNARISALQVVARAMYNNTQAKLKELGVEDVVVYRGSSRTEAQYYPAFGDRSSSMPGGETVSFKGNAAASWSTNRDTALGFTGETDGGRVPCLFKSVVPRAAIFSTAITGLGCLSESEVVVLGVGGKAKAWRTE